MVKVLICDPISEKGIDILKNEPGIQVDVKLKQTEDQIVEIAGE